MRNFHIQADAADRWITRFRRMLGIPPGQDFIVIDVCACGAAVRVPPRCDDCDSELGGE